MTKENNDDLIGYDPLAWINDNDDEQEEDKQEIVKQAVILKERPVIEPIIKEDPEEIIQEPPLDNESTDEYQNDSNIILKSNLNIRYVSELHTQLLSALEKNNILDIDASAVEMIDTANLQLLVILKQEALKLDKNIIFDFPSDKFIESATQLGISELLGLDQVASGFF